MRAAARGLECADGARFKAAALDFPDPTTIFADEEAVPS